MDGGLMLDGGQWGKGVHELVRGDSRDSRDSRSTTDETVGRQRSGGRRQAQKQTQTQTVQDARRTGRRTASGRSGLVWMITTPRNPSMVEPEPSSANG